MTTAGKLTFHPLTPERWPDLGKLFRERGAGRGRGGWPDLERLFGERGACGGCWCMVWRLRRAEFDQGKGAANKQAFQSLVLADAQPGILAYAGDEPVGWCAVAPREEYPALER